MTAGFELHSALQGHEGLVGKEMIQAKRQEERGTGSEDRGMQIWISPAIASTQSIFPHGLQVSQVLFTTQGFLIGYEIFTADIVNRQIPEQTLHPARPGLFP